MNIRSLTYAASALALGLATLVVAPKPMQAQPLWDRVDVNLPYSVSIGDRTLQPGNYVIQQLDDPSGGSQVLLIYSDNGMKFQTSALTIPALQNRTQPDTRVVLHHIGNDYYFDKVWIQGKDYGYEFPLPNSVKMRERETMQPVSVAATASSIQPTTSAAQTTQTAATNQSTAQQATTGQATTPAMNQGTTQAANQQATTQQATNPPVTNQQATTQQATNPPVTNQQATTQQAANPPVTNQQATSQPATNQPMTMPAQSNEANRTDETPAMPHTSAGWLMMLISGGALSGLGAKLRARK